MCARMKFKASTTGRENLPPTHFQGPVHTESGENTVFMRGHALKPQRWGGHRQGVAKNYSDLRRIVGTIQLPKNPKSTSRSGGQSR